MARGFLAALLVALIAASPSALGDDMPHPNWAPDGADVATFREVPVEGIDLYVVTEERRPRGVARVGERSLTGPAAFEVVVDALDDPAAAELAALSMLFLEDGVAGRNPWTTAKSGAVPSDQQALVEAPRVDADRLVYWRLHEQTADLVRVEIDLSTLEASTRRARAILEERDPRDPVEIAREEIVADALPTIRKGIGRLVEEGSPRALALVLDLVANHQAAVVRAAAVEALADEKPAQGVQVISQRLTDDPDDDVRLAAARTLEAWSDPASAEVLEQAAEHDDSAAVRATAKRALASLE